jgi:hypothetical protein
LITICIEDRRCLFGSILDGVMEASVPALMAESWWHYLPRRFPGVDIHAFVVMPNHVHGIVVIGTEPGFETNLEPGPVVGWYKPITAHDYGIGVDQYGFPPCAGRLW